jgi:hypothetical protein
MAVCPSCSQPTFDQGWCTYCGYTAKAQVLVGKPLPEAVPLDLDALMEIEPLEAEPLPMEALEELPMDALVVEEPAALPLEALEAIDEAALIPIEPEEPPVEPMDGLVFVETAGEVQVSLIDGLETTGIEPRAYKPKAQQVIAAAEFQVTACPNCEAQQPDPAPVFCESCGQRLKSKYKSKADKAASDKVKCRECGVPNKMDASNCVNCGFKLKIGIG